MSMSARRLDPFRTTVAEGQVQVLIVEELAALLANQMRKIHGGEWRCDICHNNGIVLVAARIKGDSIPRPKRGEVL